MAAGGFKTFTTGEVLTSADTNNFLMQGVLVFDDAAARDAAITAPVEGQVVYLKDTNAVLSYDGTSYVGVGGSSPLTTKGDLYTFSTVDARLGVGANDTVLTADSAEATGLKWAAPAGGGGKVLQVVSATTTTSTTIANTVLQDTSITATITPTLATSKILVLVSAQFNLSRSAAFAYAAAELKRDAVTIMDYDRGNEFEWAAVQATGATTGRLVVSASIVTLDSPATTSATTYKLQARTPTTADSNAITFQLDSAPSTITLLEIGV